MPVPQKIRGMGVQTDDTKRMGTTETRGEFAGIQRRDRLALHAVASMHHIGATSKPAREKRLMLPQGHAQ